MTKASLVVLAYNQLSYTTLCIDSIYKYSKDVDFELITVNNGSTDGTKEYFDSLPNKKKINYETNVGIEKAINDSIDISEGEYYVLINNDIILTTNWLSNIVKVLDSDPKVGAVVPASNTPTNDQIVYAEYTNTTELQEFARNYNVSNPRKWEERVDLTMYLVAFRTKELIELGKLDTAYSPGGHDDDDLSFRYRRAGYKLILAYDTYVHHYGSVTMVEHYVDRPHMNKNHLYFINKFGVDVYQVIFSMNYLVLLNLDCSKKGDLSFLSVGRTCGNTMLRAKNILKRNEWIDNIETTYYSLGSLYLTDLKTLFDTVILGSLDKVDESISNNKYDFIFIEEDFSTLGDLVISNLLSNFRNNLKENGDLFITFTNTASSTFRENLENIIEDYNYSISDIKSNDKDCIYILRPPTIIDIN
ncbi:glycosyltransferase family 2 protein [Clostridium paraputrificum]|uniref:glycosyltransferase family 2 protein n=1 Tax=Clostridium TaxID=1485 RepID=UPI003D3397B3